jgi:cytochrome bd ubiquinol oxidase subunit II
METIWFTLVALMLTAYVILDGFDLGAGILHLALAKTDQERRTVLGAIGPVWDGNEVWLIAAGGTIFFAFPGLYASSFSGFYLPLMIVLWLLILRALGIEVRRHSESPVWRDFFDGLFFFSSALLTIFLGAALGNVIRGVPLGQDGYFFAPLWTNWRPGPQPGILDWYTVICGLLAFIALSLHGSTYLAVKTEGELNIRARRVSRLLWPVLLLMTIVSLVATVKVRPGIVENFQNHIVGYVIPFLVAASVAALPWMLRRNHDKGAFLASCVYLGGMLAGAAFALYPYVLPSSGDPALSLTIYNTATGRRSLSLGLIWWSFGMCLAIGYFVFIYRMFRGKVRPENGDHAY